MISKPIASHSVDSSAAVASSPSAVIARFKPKTISGSILSERRFGSVSVAELLRALYRVFVHVGPNQGFKLKHAPHGLIGIANLAADCFVSTCLAEPLECCFNLISHVEIKIGSRGRKDCHRPPCFIRRQQFLRQRFLVSVRHRSISPSVALFAGTRLQAIRVAGVGC